MARPRGVCASEFSIKLPSERFLDPPHHLVEDGRPQQIGDVAYLDQPLAKTSDGLPFILDGGQPHWLLACCGKSGLAS
jgi:hypothetical protein